MTSSSDPGRWRPLALGAAGAAPVAFTARAESAPLPGGPRAPGWLPPLRSGSDLRAEQHRRAREQEVYQRGVEEGRRAERELADSRCATALRAVAAVAEHLEQITGEFTRDRELDLRALGIAVARHVVQRELASDPALLGDLVRRALEQLPLDQTLEVRVHPEDLETLQPSLAGLAPSGRVVQLLWTGDPGIDRGGFTVQTPHRIIDGRTDVALRALYERFDHD